MLYSENMVHASLFQAEKGVLLGGVVAGPSKRAF